MVGDKKIEKLILRNFETFVQRKMKETSQTELLTVIFDICLVGTLLILSLNKFAVSLQCNFKRITMDKIPFKSSILALLPLSN